jgi:hypothetical protein
MTDAFTARRRSARVMVTFATRPGSVRTREGVVRYGAGAAIVTAATGEQWPVERARFDADYRPTGSTVHGTDGAYLRIERVVRATRLPQPLQVAVGAEGDLIRGETGDWLVDYAPGEQGIVSPEIFRETYELLGPAP